MEGDRRGCDRPPHPTSADTTDAPEDARAEGALGRVNWHRDADRQAHRRERATASGG
ncbi:MAG: hypothetical protein ABWY83_02010 [Actinomycetota bacterium]